MGQIFQGFRLRLRREHLGFPLDRVLSPFRGAVLPDAHISIFFDFYRPPYGGGNQFLRALRREFERRGFQVENNAISRATRACLFNSYNFDFERLRRHRREGCCMVHRVDGPISAYRGQDDGTDGRIRAINREIADVTVFQSRYSLGAHRALGLDLTSPVTIMNAVDPCIFSPAKHHSDPRGRKVRLISTSWSSNPNKGEETYKWLDTHLDWTRYEYTFMGRTTGMFRNIRVVEPQDSRAVADQLRQHDIYIAASLYDPCSNALLEALACGLPAIYAASGGHPEIVGEAGFGFSSPEAVPALLDRLVDEYEQRRERIAIPTLAQVADQYLSVMGLEACAQARP